MFNLVNYFVEFFSYIFNLKMLGFNGVSGGSWLVVFNHRIYRILRYLVNYNLQLMYRLAFLFFMICYDCLLYINSLFEQFRWFLIDYIWVSRSATTTSELRSYLEERRRTFKKIPDHLLLILGPEKPSHEDLARIIYWCEPIGIKHISFYDNKNGIDPQLVFEAVKRNNKHIIQKIKWGKSFSEDIKKASIKEINGYRWEGVVRVNILGKEDGNSELLEVIKEFHNYKHSSDALLTQATLCSAMERRLGAPPPDLAVVCGPALSYFACMPWHLRLTQFIHIQSHHSMRVSKFLNCLHQYSNSEQRFGK